MKRPLYFIIVFLFLLMLPSCGDAYSSMFGYNHIHGGKHYPSIEATCVTPGQKDFYQCDTCGKIFIEKPSSGEWLESKYFSNVSENDEMYIQPLGHFLDFGTITTNPTAFLEGKKQYTCLRCGESIEESIPPLINSSLAFEETNYKTVLGKAIFDGSILKSSAPYSLIINRSIEFKCGHISSNFHCGSGNFVGGIVFASDELASNYYSVNLEICGRLYLQKKQETSEKCISSFKLPYFSPLISYKVEVFFSHGHILCFVYNQFCLDFRDDFPIEGDKFGFISYDQDSYISSIFLSENETRNNYIDLKKDSLIRKGSFSNYSSKNEAVVFYRHKLKKGTTIQFIGDYSIYEWKVYQFFDFDILSDSAKQTNDDTPFYIDSLWSSSGDFSGCDCYTFALSRDSFLCLGIRRSDYKELDDDEINGALNMFGIVGELSFEDENDKLILFTEARYGDVYNWSNNTVVSLRVLKKMPVSTTIKFTGDCSIYKWSVMEMKHCYHDNVDLNKIIDNIYGSNWNNISSRSNGFENKDKYTTITNNSYLDIRLSFVDGRQMSSFPLYEVYNLFEIENNLWCTIQNKRNDIIAINHRGYNCEAPENTLSAFSLSKEKGFERVETDVSCTKDGVPVLLHDDSINRTARTTNGERIQQEIFINDISFDEVRKYDFGIWKNDCFRGEKIPSFEEFIEFCKYTQLHPYIELKNTLSIESVADCIRIVNKYGMEKQCTWISFYSNRLSAVRFYSEGSRIGLLTGSNSFKVLSKLMSLVTDLNTVFIDQYAEDESLKYSAMISSAIETSLEVWTIDDLSVLKYIPVSVSGITSNYLTTQDLRSTRNLI